MLLSSTLDSKLTITRKRKISGKDEDFRENLDKEKQIYARDNDFISKLPDDILMNIISSASKIKEAARTSIISRRWRDLWKFLPGILDFDSSDFTDKLYSFQDHNLDDKESDRILKLLLHILKLHKGPLHELRIRLDGTGKYNEVLGDLYLSNKLDELIKIIIEKRLKILKLDMHIFKGCTIPPLDSLGSNNFTSLVSLHLINAQVSSQLIGFFLSNSPLLEVLCIKSERKLKSLSHDNIRILEVSAPKLRSFKYHGEETIIHFEHVPRLTEVSLGGSYCEVALLENFQELSNLLPQLESLELLISLGIPDEDFPPLPIMKNLKEMQLSLDGDPERWFCICLLLMDASPLLIKSSLNLRWDGLYPCSTMQSSRLSEFVTGLGKLPLHSSLKVLKVVGYRGCDNSIDTGLVMYLTEYASSIEKLIIDPGDYKFSELVRIRAGRLKLPCRVKLEIL